MKTTVAGLALGISVLGITSSAQASTFFKLDSFNVNLNSTDPGLVLHWDSVLDTLDLGTFEVGESKTVDLFKIWTDETTINRDDLAEKPIAVDFQFALPEMFGGTVEGDTFGKRGFFGILQTGKVEWGSPSILTFGNGGELEVSLSDEIFNFGLFGTTPGAEHGATVEATFTLNKESVPEPSGLIGLGLLGLGLLKKKLPSKRAV